jgi:surfactin synthase thioesterase subunit
MDPVGYFLFGIGLGFLLGFRICAVMSRRHLETMRKIWAKK